MGESITKYMSGILTYIMGCILKNAKSQSCILRKRRIVLYLFSILLFTGIEGNAATETFSSGAFIINMV